MTGKTVTIVETTNEAIIDATTVEVVSVGTQGPAGPNTIGGKGLPNSETAPTDGDLLKYSSSSDRWEFTQEIDAGTY